jgi:septum formation protein
MRLWRGGAPLLLASTSPTRRALLDGAGLAVETEAPGVDERAVEGASAAPPVLAQRLAREKALAVSRRRPGRIVAGADQTLDLGGQTLHKVADIAAAHAQLKRLVGRTHSLHSAFALARDGAVLAEGADRAHLAMRLLDDGAIALYLALTGEDSLASVGIYRYEALGVHLFETVEGDHATILGFPLLPFLAALRRLGLLAL